MEEQSENTRFTPRAASKRPPEEGRPVFDRLDQLPASAPPARGVFSAWGSVSEATNFAYLELFLRSAQIITMLCVLVSIVSAWQDEMPSAGWFIIAGIITIDKLSQLQRHAVGREGGETHVSSVVCLDSCLLAFWGLCYSSLRYTCNPEEPLGNGIIGTFMEKADDSFCGLDEDFSGDLPEGSTNWQILHVGILLLLVLLVINVGKGVLHLCLFSPYMIRVEEFARRESEISEQERRHRSPSSNVDQLFAAPESAYADSRPFQEIWMVLMDAVEFSASVLGLMAICAIGNKDSPVLVAHLALLPGILASLASLYVLFKRSGRGSVVNTVYLGNAHMISECVMLLFWMQHYAYLQDSLSQLALVNIAVVTFGVCQGKIERS
ncbi:MAG: hypothetical protein SGCHY_002525 [Lobulomycetales sp.]